MCVCVCLYSDTYAHIPKNPMYYSEMDTGGASEHLGVSPGFFAVWTWTSFLGFWTSVSSSVKKDNFEQMISSVLPGSKASNSNSDMKGAKSQLYHWPRLSPDNCNVTRMQGAKGTSWVASCSSDDCGMENEGPGLEWHAGRQGVLALSCDFLLFLFSSLSPLLIPVSSPLDLSPARRLAKGFRSGWERALLTLQAESTTGSQAFHKVGGWTESNKTNKQQKKPEPFH